ncbi:MAG TPA: hypothetical protein VK738_19910 [Terriglobales bacterium]|jgi:outer membrane protein assembly factor BamB|nr:hypothetical protein [Terriglobales bacterium]
MKSARTVVSLICLATCLLGATRHKAKPQLPASEVELTSTHPSGHRPRQIPPQVLPDGRMVVVADDTVYMLSGDGKRVWKYAIGDESDDASIYSGEAVWKVVFSAALSELLLDCDDNLTILLDADTGKVKYKHQHQGAEVDAILSAYRNGYLGQGSLAGYGQHEPDSLFYEEIDSKSGEENVIWSVDVPIDAEIFVDGDRIYYVKRIYTGKTGHYSIRLQELHPPQATQRPGGI